MDGWSVMLWGMVVGLGGLTFLRVVAAGVSASEGRMRLLERREQKAQCERLAEQVAVEEESNEVYVAELADTENAA